MDTCNTCDILKLKISTADDCDKPEILAQQRLHQETADFGYNSKKGDISSAKSDPSKLVYVFDMQQVLPTPYLKSNVAYYKRQLHVYNLRAHNCITGEPVCFMWHEVIGRRGANEISSCLFQLLKSIPQHIKHVTFYSDNCFGQNKNYILATMFSLFTADPNYPLESIDHKFLEVGHTHMECDADHSRIEKKKKNSNVKIHHPRDWLQLVRSIGGKNSFSVVEIDQQNIRNFSNIGKKKLLFRKVSDDGNPVRWKDIRWLKYNGAFAKILFKYSLSEDEPFKELNIQKRGVTEISIDSVEKCYKDLLPISVEKKKI